MLIYEIFFDEKVPFSNQFDAEAAEKFLKVIYYTVVGSVHFVQFCHHFHFDFLYT